MTNQPTTEKLDQATALLDLCNRLAEQTIQHGRRLENLEATLRAMHESNLKRDEALTALSRSVEALAALLAGVDILQAPPLH